MDGERGMAGHGTVEPPGTPGAGRAVSFSRSIRRLATEGRLGEGLVHDWEQLRTALDDNSRIVESAVADAGTTPPPLSHTVTLLPETGLASAVLSARRIVVADPDFYQLFPNVDSDAAFSCALAAIVAAARKGRPVYVTLPTSSAKLTVVAAARGDRVAHWPLGDAVRRALVPGSMQVVLVAYSPTMGGGYARFIASAYRLTPAEVRVAVATLEETTAEHVAARLGLSPATVRQRLRSLLRKTGATRRSELIGRLIDVVTGEHLPVGDRLALVRQAFGLTLAEARVAVLIASGLTLPAVAARLDISIHTARSHKDAVLDKIGLRRLPELARLIVELYALVSFVSCAKGQRLPRTHLLRATRIVAVPNGRRIAVADYGPSGATPVLCFHGSFSNRWMPSQLVSALQGRGLRPISLDRPGFGSTDLASAASPGENPFESAATDVAIVLEELGLDRVRILANDGGVGAALAFARKMAPRIVEGVLVTPRAPSQHARAPGGFVATFRRVMVASPATLTTIVETLRRQGRPEFLLALVRRIVDGCPADEQALVDPEFRAELIGSAIICAARTPMGVIGEHLAYQAGWTPPGSIGGRRWVVFGTGHDTLFPHTETDLVWHTLPGLEVRHLRDAGRFARFSHAREIASAFHT